MQDTGYQQIAEAAWREMCRPARRLRPRVARNLESAQHDRVPTKWGEVAVWRMGEGPRALLVHGWGDDHTLWTPMIDRLFERGRSVLTLDLPGHGMSGGEESSVRIATDAVLAVAEAYGPIYTSIGHSLGGLATAMAIREGMQVDSAVIIGTARHRRVRLDSLAKERGFDADVVATICALNAARFGATDMEISIPDLSPYLKVPAMIVHSHDDERVPMAAALASNQAWEGSTLHAVHGPNHRNTARDPEVIERILDFVG